MRKIVWLAVLLAGAPAVPTLGAPAWGQAAQARTQEDAAVGALRTSMDASAHATLVIVVRDARSRGLPAQPLIAKAQEGAAKNVPGDRIIVAVQATAERLARAQVLLHAGGVATPVEISAVADALQRGVPEEAIVRLVADSRGHASVGLSAHALADLLGHNVPVAVAVEVIGAWRAHGADASRLNEIPAAVERLVRQGVVPARAGAAVAAGIRVGRAPGSITPAEVPRMIGRRGG
jgi:hypothetical protein